MTKEVALATRYEPELAIAYASGLREKAEELLEVLRTDPWQQPPRFERLVGDLAGAYSGRINVQRRLVYQVLPKQRTVKVLRMWTHYE
jgi:Txe/YoeB family toxin of toxin-antitoxin system